MPLLRQIGYKAAFVAQDGLYLAEQRNELLVINNETNHAMFVSWADFDVLFIGGSTKWKLGLDSQAIAREAIKQGKWLHMGRVNSYKRFMLAASIDCDSVDGTFLAFGPTVNLVRLENWLTRCKEAQKLYEQNH